MGFGILITFHDKIISVFKGNQSVREAYIHVGINRNYFIVIKSLEWNS